MAMKCPNCGAENPEGKKFCGDCGMMVVSSSLVSEQHGPAPRIEPYKLRVNVFCLVGAIIAVLSLSLPWATVQDDHGFSVDLGAFDFHDTASQLSYSFELSITLFFIGCVLVFFSPLAGVPLFIGSVGFWMTATTIDIHNLEMIPGTGAGLALIASVFVLGSLIAPLGPGYSLSLWYFGGKVSGLASRFLVWGIYR